jgi:hypothetical protein
MVTCRAFVVGTAGFEFNGSNAGPLFYAPALPRRDHIRRHWQAPTGKHLRQHPKRDYRRPYNAWGLPVRETFAFQAYRCRIFTSHCLKNTLTTTGIWQ